MKQYILKQFTLWTAGAMLYGIIEIMFRGYSHISMGILGGICFIIVGEINKHLCNRLSVFIQMLFCAVIITALEYATGLIVNVRMGLSIWDYSGMPMNISGQVCLLFFVIWYFLSFIGIIFYQFIGWIILKEEKPALRLFRFKLKNV